MASIFSQVFINLNSNGWVCLLLSIISLLLIKKRFCRIATSWIWTRLLLLFNFFHLLIKGWYSSSSQLFIQRFSSYYPWTLYIILSCLILLLLLIYFINSSILEANFGILLVITLIKMYYSRIRSGLSFRR